MLSRAEPTRSVGARLRVLTLLLYLALDCANPMMAGAVAFGVGFLVAAAFPPSRTEEQLAEQAMDKAEPLKQQLMESGQEVAEHLKESATEAVEQVKQTATEGAGQVADTAKAASQTTKDSIRDAAETTRQEATNR